MIVRRRRVVCAAATARIGHTYDKRVQVALGHREVIVEEELMIGRDEDLALARDQLDVRHGYTVHQVAVDHEANLDALVGEADHVREHAHDVIGLAVPLECVVGELFGAARVACGGRGGVGRERRRIVHRWDKIGRIKSNKL